MSSRQGKGATEEILPLSPSEIPSKRTRPPFTLIHLIFLAGMLGLLIIPVVSSFLRGQAQGRLSACSKSRLHNIATAVEMYSRDFGGHYPEKLSQLTPNYLRQIPVCPENEYSYSESYLTGKVGRNKDGRFDDYYILYCKLGHPSLGVPAGYPQYDSDFGIILR